MTAFTVTLTTAEVKAILDCLEIVRLAHEDVTVFAMTVQNRSPAERTALLLEIAKVAFALAPQLQHSPDPAKA